MEKETNNTIQTFWILVGSLSAFGFTIISSMILSRYFDKHEYGTYRQVMYVYSSFLVAFTLGLPKAYSYFLPRVERDQAKSLITKVNLILLMSGILMSSFIFFGSNWIASFLKNDDLIEPLKYFSLVPLFMLPTMGLEGILSTYQKTKFLAFYNIVTRILMLLCVTVPVYYFQGSVNSAIIGFTFASFISFLLALILKYLPVKDELKNPSEIEYKEILNYTIPIMFAGIWGILISSADQFFISRYFGNEVFADFANGSIELPFVAMIVSASSIVLGPIFSKQVFDKGDEAKEDIIKLWQSVFSKTVKLIYPLVIFSFCFADIIMIVLYGENYSTSGVYFQIKLIVNFFTLIAYSPLLLSIGGGKYYFKVHMYGALILILLEWLTIYIVNSPIAITIVSVVCQIGRIFAMLLFISIFFKIKLIDLFPLKLITTLLFPSLIFIYVIKYLLKDMIYSHILLLIISGMLYTVFFVIWIYYRKIEYYSIIKPILFMLKK